MKRLSMQHGSGPEPLEIRNTGLRPNWNSFWALETSSSDYEPLTSTSHAAHASLVSSKSGISGGTTATGQGIRHVKFITGSEWIGEWDRAGMTGMGMYKMPHGVIYEGTMKAGLFEGVGVLKYPNGSFLEGLWYQGKLKYWQYTYPDGLERDCQSWTYCSMPDRRFHSEHVAGFKPANAEQVSNDYPAREVPSGHYDVGQGFYNPKSHCVVDAVTGEVLSIPTADEEKWIIERCRTSEPIEPVGYRPNLYENWYSKKASEQHTPPEEGFKCSIKEFKEIFAKGSDRSHDDTQESWFEEDSDQIKLESEKSTIKKAEQEILSLLKQEGAKLASGNTSEMNQRKHSLHDKIEGQGVFEQRQPEPFRGASFEGLLKKVLKEMETQKNSGKTSDDSGAKIETSSESNFFRLTQMIRKKTGSSSLGSGGALEQFRIIGKLLPSLSLTNPKHFSYSYSSTSRSNESGEKERVEKVVSEKIAKKKSEENVIISTNYENSE